jgi:hypothetical protein
MVECLKRVKIFVRFVIIVHILHTELSFLSCSHFLAKRPSHRSFVDFLLSYMALTTTEHELMAISMLWTNSCEYPRWAIPILSLFPRNWSFILKWWQLAVVHSLWRLIGFLSDLIPCIPELLSDVPKHSLFQDFLISSVVWNVDQTRSRSVKVTHGWSSVFRGSERLWRRDLDMTLIENWLFYEWPNFWLGQFKSVLLALCKDFTSGELIRVVCCRDAYVVCVKIVPVCFHFRFWHIERSDRVILCFFGLKFIWAVKPFDFWLSS